MDLDDVDVDTIVRGVANLYLPDASPGHDPRDCQELHEIQERLDLTERALAQTRERHRLPEGGRGA